MAPQPQLTVQCQIVGHASPRWKGASSEAQRVENNEVLSRQRADAFMKEFKPALTRELGKYQLRFLENVSYADDQQPDQTAVIGTEGRGQRDSLPLAGGDKKNDAEIFRRTDVVVRIARSTQDAMPTKVRQSWDRSTKSKFWYASVGVGGSVTAVAGFEFFRVKLRNNMGDEASGSVAAVSGGVGAKYSYSPYSWTDEASFSTNREVGFGDFHGTRVRYTTAGLVIGIGYSRAYLTFYGMGPDAASLHVGGWSTGAQVSLDVAEGILILDTVPANHTIDYYDDTEWNDIRSDWITQQMLSVFFETGKATLSPARASEIRAFAAKVATDIRTN
jgi:hypothetical protein